MNKVRSRILLPILSAALALVLASCEIRVHTDLMVDEDESGVLSSEVSFDDQLMRMAGMSGQEMFSDEMLSDEMLPDGGGWSIEPVAGEYTGLRVSLAFDSLDDLSAQLDEMTAATGGAFDEMLGGDGMTDGSGLGGLAAGAGILSDFSLTRDGDAFVFRAAVPDTGAMMDEAMGDDSIPVDMSMLEDIFDARFTLTLPGEIVSSNADMVTGQTLVWELSLGGGAHVMEARSEVPSSGAGMIIALAVALLVLAAIVYIALDRRRRSAEEAAAPAEEAAAAEETPSDPCNDECGEDDEPECCSSDGGCCETEEAD